jgi:hypothetical protein
VFLHSQCEGREFDPPPPNRIQKNPRSAKLRGFLFV